ncbi:unnamed protein product [Prunus armeniaca]|uniref:Uncharacterized protein n=1 Tax=Prunus armeniaca TaxID=36596 RepID=A0A6J5YBF0_PRUAR|nr:unnamed protein product [Prunus armeniaca]
MARRTQLQVTANSRDSDHPTLEGLYTPAPSHLPKDLSHRLPSSSIPGSVFFKHPCGTKSGMPSLLNEGTCDAPTGETKDPKPSWVSCRTTPAA